MTHPRLTPNNGRVAHVSLAGKAAADHFVAGDICTVSAPVADLVRSPGGGLDCQILYGSDFLVLEREGRTGFAFGQHVNDGYCGYLRLEALGPKRVPDRKVAALASHIYSKPDIKSRVSLCLPFGARLATTTLENGFFALAGGGFCPAQHLVPIDSHVPDFVSVIERFVGIPYLWGGNSSFGMDCSGALQLGLQAAGLICPRDSDMQAAELGRLIAPDAPTQRGDLMFWKGHVGVLCDPETLLHANAHHMAVTVEPLKPAIKRIKAKGGGPVTAIKRL